MDRFFVEEEQIVGDEIFIRGEDVRHISGALRLDENDSLEVVASSRVYLCKIDRVLKDEIRLKVLDSWQGQAEAKTRIHLYQGLAKGSRMDYVLQKCTEIGVDSFTIVEMERSVSRLKGDKKTKSKMGRWQKIADEAAKQCRREHRPQVKAAIDFKEMLEELKGQEHILIPYEEEDRSQRLKDKLEGARGQRVNIIIGPEGGISQDEIAQLKHIGGRSLSLGPRILRTETSGLVASALVLYELGDI